MHDVRRNQGGAVIDGAPLPVTYREAVQWLSARLYLRTTGYRTLHASFPVAGLDDDVQEFVRVYQRHLANIGIPLNVDVGLRTAADAARLYVLGLTDSHHAGVFASGRAISVCHAIRGHDLPDIAWRVFRHVAVEAGSRLGLTLADPISRRPSILRIDPA